VIIYAGGEYVTGDAIALALMYYSRGLADEGAAETVEIPILSQDGSPVMATFLVGPSSQIVAKDVDSEYDELVDSETVARLQRLTDALRLTARPGATPEQSDWAEPEV